VILVLITYFDNNKNTSICQPIIDNTNNRDHRSLYTTETTVPELTI
jgi:hypothetical protein